MAPKVYLITGASRGIGLALVNELATNKTNIRIFTGARNPATASKLKDLSLRYPGKITIVKYISGDEEVNEALAKEIWTKHGYLDVIIACAGIASYMGTAAQTPSKELRNHFEVNTIGTLVLFQAVYKLLKESTSSPRFIPISSAAASLTEFIDLPFQYTCYGASKAALNYVSRKIHFENDWLVCFPLAPGVIITDMANATRAMDVTGLAGSYQDSAAIPTEEAARMLVGIVERATRAKDGGEFINIDGQKMAW
ncbi:NAD(P)-binding protein [Collybia nuda]|uniref:NAD(P)-binding protein n=1 Tax=Collybia nuda TaxID=64659 RepID=A0A9P6CBY1_9AGAR|nr:NAD(P)-binding protein [Collybia nuda]